MVALSRPIFARRIANATWAQKGYLERQECGPLNESSTQPIRCGDCLRLLAEPCSVRRKGPQCRQPSASRRHQVMELALCPSSRTTPSAGRSQQEFRKVGRATLTRAQSMTQPEESRSSTSTSSHEQRPAGVLSRREVVELVISGGVLSSICESADPAVASESPLPALSEQDNQNVQLVIGSGCGLGVSIYPDFEYDAKGSGGIGYTHKERDGRIRVEFDPSTLQIPPVSFSTTKFLKLPLPPPLKIAIESKKLEGYIEPATGKVELDFLAEFVFTAGPLYKAKPLVVGTTLTTESSQGLLRSGQGQRLDGDGRCILVGVARVAPVNDPLLDPFLMLPTDCLARLPAQFVFQPRA